MMQTMFTVRDGITFAREMPDEDNLVVPGVHWGAFDSLFTAAYWCGQTWQARVHGHFSDLRLGRSLTEETAACLLGGYGMKAELGLAAFRRLSDRGMLKAGSRANTIEMHLSKPFDIAGRSVHYRFPRQKAAYLEVCLDRLDAIENDDLDDLSLRNALMGLPGIGPKTASWVVRNHRYSSKVAVLDVHIMNAGGRLGLFEAGKTPQRDYFDLETRFVDFAAALNESACLLDAVMWKHMRLLGDL
jgi:thermostable 8-oxoguanine DNA glycosylase